MNKERRASGGSLRTRIPIRNCWWIQIPRIIDARDGIISVAEGLRNVPFAIRRVYYIYELNYLHSHRGEHAHKKLEQVLFCVHGQVTLTLDDGFHRHEITLDKPHLGVYLGPDVWVVMKKFRRDCILLVLASHRFRESDYIRDYQQFIARVRRKHDSLR
jgi:hypothetical protein